MCRCHSLLSGVKSVIWVLYLQMHHILEDTSFRKFTETKGDNGLKDDPGNRYLNAGDMHSNIDFRQIANNGYSM